MQCTDGLVRRVLYQWHYSISSKINLLTTIPQTTIVHINIITNHLMVIIVETRRFEYYSFMRYDAVESGRKLSMFRRDMLSPTSKYLQTQVAGYFETLRNFLLIVGTVLPCCRMSHLRGYSSVSLHLRTRVLFFAQLLSSNYSTSSLSNYCSGV